MSGYSNVGNRGVYEAGDQRNAPESERNVEDPYNEGKENSHNNLDSSTYSMDQIWESVLTKLQRMSDPSPTAWLLRRLVEPPQEVIHYILMQNRSDPRLKTISRPPNWRRIPLCP
jgi:hypothetical protein